MITFTIPRSNLGQNGVVSIMVSVVLMAVMTLIVLGFAEIARHDQRQTLDRQLSSQAFYAAETGVNDAQSIIEADLQTGTPPPGKTSCQPDAVGTVGGYTASNVIDNATDVSYSSLLINTTPNSLVKSLTASGPSWVVPINPVTASGATTSISKITLNWQDTNPSVANPQASCPAANSTVLPTATAWGTCGYGLLRVDLVPVSGVFSRTSLLQKDFVGYFLPSNTSASPTGNVAYNISGNLYGVAAGQGIIKSGKCTATQCEMTITGLGAGSYYMRVSDLYAPANVTIYACSTGGSTACDSTVSVHLKNAQALIDSTGKAQDVLRRVQVRVPMSNNGGLFSDYPLTSTTSICKEFSVYPSSGYKAAGTNPECSY